ncbi:hypothetical protein TNCV_2775821 [Trichonephila clavipes]|nr:hypothetical protein TNCV_2775821 [Trichonephila clavipes]
MVRENILRTKTSKVRTEKGDALEIGGEVARIELKLEVARVPGRLKTALHTNSNYYEANFLDITIQIKDKGIASNIYDKRDE